MVNYDWPGNIRELRNAVERAVLMGDTDHIVPGDLPESIYEKVPPNTVGPKTLIAQSNAAHKQIFLNALRDNDWNVAKAAEELDINEKSLYRRAKNLGIEF